MKDKVIIPEISKPNIILKIGSNRQLSFISKKIFGKFKDRILKNMTVRKEKKVLQGFDYKTKSCTKLTVKSIKGGKEISLHTQILANKNVFNLTFELDTGSSVNLINIKDLKNMELDLCINSNISVTINDYNGGAIPILGKIVLSLNIPNFGIVKVPFFVVRANYNILGRGFMSSTGFTLQFYKRNYYIDFSSSVKKLVVKSEKSIIYNRDVIIIPAKQTMVASFEVPKHYNVNDEFICYSLERDIPRIIPAIVKISKDNLILMNIINLDDFPLVIDPLQMAVGVEDLKQFIIKDTTYVSKNFGTKYHPNNFIKFRTSHTMSVLENNVFGEFYENLDQTNLIQIVKKILVKDENFVSEDIHGECSEGADKEGFLPGDNEQGESLISESYFDISQSIGIGTPQIQSNFSKTELDHMFENYSPIIRNFLTDAFLKYPILSTNPWDCGKALDNIEIEIDQNKKHLLENTKIYPLRPDMKEQLLQFLHYLVFNGIIEKSPSHMTYGSPIFLIKRKNGQQSVRLLVDQRQSNMAIKGTSCALMACITKSLKAISESAVYCTQLDLRQAFYSLPYSRETIETGLTQFITEFGCYRFLRAVTGNCRSPSKLIDYIIKYLHSDTEGNLSIISFLLCHFDDINIFSLEDNLQEHLDKVLLVISRLHRMGLRLNLEKCIFAKYLKTENMRILGYDLGYNYLSPPKEKMQAFKDIIKPTNVKSLQKFLGGLTYFRNMFGLGVINNMNILSSKMKNNQLLWDESATEAFNEIKISATEGYNVINPPTSESINIIFSDSSENSIGGVLFSAPIDALNVTKETYDLKYQSEVSNSVIKGHISTFDLKLKQLDKTNSLLEIFQKANEIFELKLEKKPHSLLAQMLTYGQMFGPSYVSKLPNINQISSKTKLFNDFLSQMIEKVEHEHDNSTDFLMHTFSAMIDRQIFLIIENNKGQKTDFIKIGQYSLKTPLFLGHSPHLGKYYIFGLTKCSEIMKCSNYKYSANMNYEKILRSFFKLLKSNNNVLTNFRIGGYFSRTLTSAERISPIYVSEGRAIFESLEFFEEQIKGRATILLTDSKICQALFSIKNVDSNKRLHKLALKLIHSFEYIKILSVPGRLQLADFLTRLDIKHPLTDKMYTKNEFNANLKVNDVQDIKFYSNWKECAKDVINGDNELFVRTIKNNDLETIFSKHLSLSKIYEEQMKEPFYNMVAGESNPNYRLDERNMIRNKMTNKLLLPNKLIFVIIAYVHNQINHAGRDALYSELKSRFDFAKNAKLKSKINDYLNICIGCLAGKSVSNKTLIGSVYNDKLQSRGDLISIDLLESSNNPTSTMPAGYLFIIDILTKHLTVYYLIKKREKDIMFSLLSYISSFGQIKRILSDNASIFRSLKFKNFCKSWGIEIVQSAPGYSQARGHVERTIGLARQQIRTSSVELTHTDVLKSLPLFVISKNFRKLANTELSPNDLQAMSILGRNSPYFVTNEITNVNTFGYRNDAYLSELNDFRSNINSDLKLTIDKLKTLKMQELKNKNKNRSMHKINTGDFVLIKNFHSSTKHEKQNLPKFSKFPFEVLSVGTHFVIAKCILTNIIVNRNIGHVKKIKIPRLNLYDLPEELYKNLGLLLPTDFDPKYLGKLDIDPNKVIGKRITRSTVKAGKDYIDDDKIVDFSDITYF